MHPPRFDGRTALPGIALRGPISLVVADDSSAYLGGLLRRLTAEPRVEIIAAVADGAQALNAIRLLRPDLALLDVDMPLLTGVEVCAAATRAGFRTRLAVMSALMSTALRDEALHAGAHAALDKALPRAVIVEQLLAAWAPPLDERTAAGPPSTLPAFGPGEPRPRQARRRSWA